MNSIDYIKQWGLLKSLKRLKGRLGLKCFDRTLVFVKKDLRSIPDKMNEPYSFHLASLKSVQEQPTYHDGWYNQKAAIDRLREGHRLFLLKEKEEIIYSAWVEFRRVKIAWFGYHFDIPDDTVYCTSSYAAPEYRNRGIAFKVDQEIATYLKKEGYRYAIGVVEPSNVASLKVIDKLGGQAYQIVRYRRFWFVKHIQVKTINSSHQKTIVTVFKLPENIWKVFY